MPPSSHSSLTAEAQQRLRDRLAQAPGGPTVQVVADGTPPEVQRLVQDLQVHQLELEMQHEELQAALATAEAARAKFAELYNFAPIALFTLHADGSIAHLNDRAGHLLGTTTARLAGRRFLLFVCPPSRDAFAAFLASILGTPQRQRIELHLQTEAGVEFVAHLEGALGTTPTGAAGVQLAVVDVTPLSHEVARRQRSEERLQLALAASAMGVWVWTFGTNLLEWDAQAQKYFGRPYDASPTSFAVLQTAVHPDDWVPMQRALQACLQHGHLLDLELRTLWPDGTVHFLAAHGKVQPDAQGRPAALVGLVRDVTDRHTAQEALAYRNRQLQQLLDNLPVVFSRLSPTGEYLELAGAGLRRVGLADNALVGRSILDEFPAITDPIRRLLAGQPSSFLSVADTADQRVYFQNFGFFDEHCQQAVLFAIDVTESEQTKKQLLDEQRFTKSLLDHYVDGVVAFDHAGRLTAWNRAMEALTGRAEAEALGQDVSACLPFDRESPPGLVVDHVRRGLRR
ncbi:MAG TPA: PAS domain S-box protein, partial [Hymenobacter sp.]